MYAGGMEVVNQRHHVFDTADGAVSCRVFAQPFLKLLVVACYKRLVMVAKTKAKPRSKVVVVDFSI
jgi:hypothetical protein